LLPNQIDRRTVSTYQFPQDPATRSEQYQPRSRISRANRNAPHVEADRAEQCKIKQQGSG
jgi:hypothetical protein